MQAERAFHRIDFMLEILQLRLYELQQFADRLVDSQLTHLSWLSIT
jgi:cytochrome c-type biogenesis protein